MLNRLSTLEEIKGVVEKGIKRDPPAAKIHSHFGDFVPMVKLLSALQLSTEIFRDKLSLADITSKSPKLLDELTKALLTKTPKTDYLDSVFDYLTEEDPPKKTDVIFVFGSRNLMRATKAADLFLQGWSPIIYFSGSHPYEDSSKPHEGTVFKEHVIKEFHIDPDSLIADPHENSLSMVDNVRGFLNYWDKTGKPLKNIIVVTTNHNLRRGWAIFNKYCSEETNLIRVGSGEADNVQRSLWHKSDVGIRLIFEEYLKIKIQHLYESS